MTRFKGTLLLLLIVGFLNAQTSNSTSPKVENSLLWKISGNGITKPSYLFGTYHLMNDGFLKNIKGLKKALKSSDVVVGELVMTPEVSAQLMPYMIMENNSLDSLLPAAQYDSVSQAFQKSMGMPMFMFNKMKPIAIYTMIGAAESQKTTAIEKNKGVPMDIYFQQEARKKDKKVLGLESVKEQADVLFNAYSLERQTELLMDYLRKKDESGDIDKEKLNDCYTKQQLDCLEEIFSKAEFSDAESLDLLNKRNQRWIPHLEEYMKKDGCFIAVGALHLSGSDGLIKLLREKGYKVVPMNKAS